MVDFGAALSGAASGGISGASIGGPFGSLVGGALGGLGGLFGGKKKKKRSTFDKKQKQLNEYEHQSILGQGPLADLYNYDPQKANDVFDQTIGRPAYRKFQEELAPNITGQFRQNGLINSSYAGDALSKIARDIQENLDAQRTDYQYKEQKESRSNKINAINNLQGRSTFAYDKAAPGGFDINSILGSITPDIVNQAKDYFGKK